MKRSEFVIFNDDERQEILEEVKHVEIGEALQHLREETADSDNFEYFSAAVSLICQPVAARLFKKHCEEFSGWALTHQVYSPDEHYHRDLLSRGYTYEALEEDVTEIIASLAIPKRLVLERASGDANWFIAQWAEV